MKRAIPFLVVFVVGVAVGYLVAPLTTSSPQPAPAGSVREHVTETATTPPMRGEGSDREPPPDPARLLGLPARRVDATREAEPGAGPRVQKDGRVKVSIQVVLPDGSAPDAATVYWTSDPSQWAHARSRGRWSPQDPCVWIPGGDAWIHATGGPAEKLESQRRHLSVSEHGPLQELRLVLEERPGIHGKVVLPGDFDQPHLEVRLHRYEGEEPPAKPVFDRSDPRASPREREGNTFAFYDLEPGGYLLCLSLGRERFVVVENVWVEDRTVERDLVLDRFDPRHYMEVYVLGPDGQPVRDVQVSISFSDDSMSASGGNVSLLRRDGTFIVDHSPEFTLQEDGTYKDGVYTVHVWTREHGEVFQAYDPRTTESLTIRIGELETLRIRLTGYEGSPAVGKLSVALRAVGEHGVSNPRPPEPDGTASFGKVQPGRYEIVFMAGRTQRELVAVHGVEFAPGDGVKEVPTPVFHRLVLRLPQHAVEPSLGLSRFFGNEQWSYGWVKDGGPGEYVFDFLPEGTYTLEGHVGERWIKREVHVPSESLVDLR